VVVGFRVIDPARAGNRVRNNSKGECVMYSPTRSFLIATAVVKAFACDGDDDGGEPDAAVDAAPDAAVDAAPDAAPDAAVDAAPDAPPPDGLTISFAGDAYGEVQIITETQYQVCSGPCTLAIAPGEVVTVIGVTPSTFAGWSGDCISADHGCTFTMASAVASVTATFAPDPGTAWTRLLTTGAVLSADFDSDGNLLLGTTAGLHKLSSSGETIWVDAALSGTAHVGPGNVVYVLSGNTLAKVDSDGDAVWTRTLANAAGSCAAPIPRMAHTWAVSPNGDIAFQRGSALEVWTSAGNPQWSVPDVGPAPRCSVAIDSTGTIATGVLDEISFEGTALSRYAPDGTPLGIGDPVASQYTFSMDYDASDTLVTSTSGHSHADVSRIGVYSHSVSVESPSYVAHGVTVDPTGEVTWAYILDEYCEPVDNFVAHHYDPMGNELWTFTKDNDWIPYPIYECNWGTGLNDLAAGGDGQVALVGQWQGPSGSHAWVSVIAP
jgi:hypothetical protein